jgi:multidrug efflux system outer membrane protein
MSNREIRFLTTDKHGLTRMKTDFQKERSQKSASAFLFLACVIAGFMLPGCAVGPNYKEPKTKTAPAYGNTSEPGVGTNQIALDWWREFHDAQLEKLIEHALTNNLDLKIAVARLREARALYRESQFDLLPSVNANGSFVKEKLSRAAVFGAAGVNRNLELFRAGFDATWELDLFGRVRRSVEANAATMEATIANIRDVQVSLLSEIAGNYLELRGLQHELDVARRNAENQRETLKITQARLEGGRGTELDVARAQAQLSSTLASLEPIETQIARAMHRIAVLSGQQPTSLNAELKPLQPMPTLPTLVNIDTPESLLRRRPDIRIAERRLAAATARIGVEVSDLFPRVTFIGNVGVEAATFAGLGKAGSDTWSFGPQIHWAAFDYGHVRNRILAADARAEALLAEYEQSVLGALEETENSLVAFGREQIRRENLRDSVKASERAAKLARIRFENGATDFLVVLDAERVLLEAQDRLAQSETQTATSLVSVYKALGGGWVDSSKSSEVSSTAK